MQIGALDADAHGIAQREAPARRAARHGVFGRIEVVEIVVHVAHGHQPFDVVLVDLDEDAPLGDARYVAGELLAQACLHELHHLVFDRGAFGLGGDHFAFRGVLAQRFECRLVGRLAAFEVACQQAVHHHVGIAADRRSEVGVVGEGQSVVADVVGGVVGFGHRTYGQRRDDVLFGAALDLLEELVHLLGDGTALGGFEDVPEAQDELPEALQLVDVRFVVDAVDHRAARLAPSDLAAELGNAAVGQQHELLDHLVGLLLFLEIDAHRPALLVEPEFGLGAVEADRTVAEPLAAHGLRQPVERKDLFGVVAPAGLDHLLRLLVGEAAVGVDHRAAEPLVEDFEVLVEGENRRKAEALLVRPQRTEFVAEPFGQHRHGAVDQIDRRAARFGFGVDHRTRPHVVRHVGDMDAHLPHAVADFADRQRVVEVLGVGRIDGEGHRLPEVAPLGVVFAGDAPVDGFGCRPPPPLDPVAGLVFGQNGVHLGVVLARLAQNVDQFAHGAFRAGRPFGDAYDDLVAVFHVRAVALVEVDVDGHLARVDTHEDIVFVDFGRADVAFAAAFDDRENSDSLGYRV